MSAGRGDGSTVDAVAEPIFLLGFARSGTTWINKVLRDYLDVGLVNEGKFIVPFAKRCEPARTIADMDRLVEQLSRDEFFNIMEKGYGFSMNWPALADNARGHDYAYVVKLILAEIARQQGKRFIGSKNPRFGWGMDVLLAHFPSAKFIHVIRDGRDCALSHYKLVWGFQNAYVAAVKWHDYISGVRDSVEQHSAHYMEIRYEDLLANPADQFMRMETFIYPEGSSKRPGLPAAKAFAASVGTEAYDQRTGKWKSRMNAHDTAIFESMAGDTLARLGYPVTGHRQTVPAWSRAWYITSNRMQKEYWHVARKISKRIGERKPQSGVLR